MRPGLRFETLEDRLCLTVAVEVVDGDLFVDGQADGAVEIRTTGQGQFEVIDNGVAVDFDNALAVTDDIRVHLDSEGAETDDAVTIDLAGQSVDRVVVRLGGGNNSLQVQGGTIGGSLVMLGRGGNDSLEVAVDTIVQGNVYARLSHGDNQVTVAGQVERALFVATGAGSDRVTVEQSASISRYVYLNLGRGENATSIAGSLSGSLLVRGGSDIDTVDLLATALVARNTRMYLGSGDNSLNVAGSIDGDLSYFGRGGDDQVQLTGAVGGDANVRLRGGNNGLVVTGSIDGDLRASSNNADDEQRVEIADGAVAGQTSLRIGDPFTLRDRLGSLIDRLRDFLSGWFRR